MIQHVKDHIFLKAFSFMQAFWYSGIKSYAPVVELAALGAFHIATKEEIYKGTVIKTRHIHKVPQKSVLTLCSSPTCSHLD